MTPYWLLNAVLVMAALMMAPVLAAMLMLLAFTIIAPLSGRSRRREVRTLDDLLLKENGNE